MRFTAIGALGAATLMLGACETTHNAMPAEPIVVTQTVDKPVLKSCVPPNLPDPNPRSVTGQTLRALVDSAAREILLLQGYQELADRLDLVEPVIAACRKVGQ